MKRLQSQKIDTKFYSNNSTEIVNQIYIFSAVYMMNKSQNNVSQGSIIFFSLNANLQKTRNDDSNGKYRSKVYDLSTEGMTEEEFSKFVVCDSDLETFGETANTVRRQSFGKEDELDEVCSEKAPFHVKVSNVCGDIRIFLEKKPNVD